MKKLIFIALLSLSTISCQKKYACYCGSNGNYNQAQTVPPSIDDTDRSQVSNYCFKQACTWGEI